jgi:hypothetical protein
MSESPKKEKSLSSPVGGWTYPNVSQGDEKVIKFKDDKRDAWSEADAFTAARDIEVSGDDSSYSSFYSFLKTDKSDSSMKSHLECANANPANHVEVIAIRNSNRKCFIYFTSMHDLKLFNLKLLNVVQGSFMHLIFT